MMTNADQRPTSRALGQDSIAAEPGVDDLMRERRLQRNLKFLVGFLGALILASLAAVAVGIMSLPTTPQTQTAKLDEPLAAGGEIALEIPKGSKVVSVSMSGNRLAVHHEGPTGPGISILDLATGARLAVVRPVEEAPPNQ